MGRLVSTLVAIGLVAYVARQCRRPSGWLGRLLALEMGGRHSGLTDWALSHVTIARDATLLDIGCGGGKTVQKMAAMAADGRVFAVDYSPTCVGVARRANAAAIAAGRVSVQQASVAQLPFPDATFDLATAIETHYYWPDLVANLREVRRVLKPGGRVLIVAEAYRRHRGDVPLGWVMRMLGGVLRTAAEHREALANAGFEAIEIDEVRKKIWIAAIGRRPESDR